MSRRATLRTLTRTCRVLVVEDDPTHVELTAARLRHHPVELVAAADLATALTDLATADFDCALVDLYLPDAVGIDVLSALRLAAPALPVVVNSTDVDLAVSMCLEGGAHAAVSKTRTSGDQLWEAFSSAMRRHEGEAHHKHSERLAELLEVSLEDGDAGAQVASALAAATATLRMDLGLVSSVAGERYTVHHAAGAGAPPAGTVFALGDTYCALTLGASDVVAIDHMGASEHASHPCYEAFGLESYIGAPVIVDGRVWGTVNFSSPSVRVRHWSMQDTLYVRRLAGFVGRLLQRQADRDRHAQVQAQFELAFEHAPIGMLLSGPDARFLRVNATLCAQTGWDADDLIGQTFAAITHPDDVDSSRGLVEDLLSGHRSVAHIEKRYVRPDGTVWWGRVVTSLTRRPDGSPLHFVTQVEDVTRRRQVEERLTHRALHDELTGLPNRAQLEDRLEQQLASSRRTGQITAVLFLDLDRFKQVNDSLGHAAGDDLLAEVANRLRATVRPGDAVARLGGDEFVVVCGGLHDTTEVEPVAQRILRSLAHPVAVGATTVTVGASIGVAVARADDPRGPQALLRDADTALYRAKESGKGRAEVFTHALRERAMDRLELETDLRRALAASATDEGSDAGHLLLHYQTQHDVVTRRVVGIEALVRWEHPRRGLLQPASFLPMAEETGMVEGLGRWVLRQACREVAARADLADVTVSVNVSAHELAVDDYVGHVEAILGETRLAAGRLCLEVTETAAIGRAGSAVAALRRLRELGVRLSIDDFGTGYASLSHLAASPFTELKVDRSFVSGLERDSSRWAIVEAITRMCDALDVPVVAEGVETERDLALVGELGCATAQGFLLGRPAVLADLDPRSLIR